MRIGDRVRILGSSHPWYGARGVIVRTFTHPDLDWVVALDDRGGIGGQGQECAAAERELRLEPADEGKA